MPDFTLIAILYTLAYASPALLVTAIFGIYTWKKFRDEPLGRLAALFALKPLLATPLFALMVAGIFGQNQLSLLVPGAMLTLVIVLREHRTLMANPMIALLLITGDALRWILPYLMNAQNLPLLIPALIWTSVFGGLCWYLARRTSGQVGLAPA